MSEFVRCRDCKCPGTPHEEEGDGVYLRPTLDLAGGLAAESALLTAARIIPLGSKPSAEEQERVTRERTDYLRPRWFDIFLRHGAVDWNLMAEDGPIPFDVDELIGDYTLARPAAEKANDLYAEAVLAPFQTPPPKHSRNGRTAGGIRPPSEPTPLPSRRSSRAASEGGQSSVA